MLTYLRFFIYKNEIILNLNLNINIYLKNLKIILIKNFRFFLNFFFKTNIEKIIKYYLIIILLKILIRRLILYSINSLLIFLIFVNIKIANLNLKKILLI